MSTIAALLGEFGLRESESEFVSALRAALTREPRAGAVTLPAAEEQVLAEHSGIDPLAASAAADPRTVAVARGRIELDQLRRSRTVGELATAWQVDASRIRHRVRNGALYGQRTGRHLRLPDWQFDAELRPLPGLLAVLAALPEGMHPREVEGFMTTPQPDLRLRGRAVSPRDWLLAGGRSEPVTEQAGDLDRW